MISNELRLPFKGLPQMQPRPPVQEDTLKSGQVQIERKTITFILKETRAADFSALSRKGVGIAPASSFHPPAWPNSKNCWKK